MDYIKYFVPPTFNKQGFCDLLRGIHNVEAYAMPQGVAIDREALNKIPKANMAHWVYLNIDSINNSLRARPLTPEELEAFHREGKFLYEAPRKDYSCSSCYLDFSKLA
jgi:hypothetical protein